MCLIFYVVWLLCFFDAVNHPVTFGEGGHRKGKNIFLGEQVCINDRNSAMGASWECSPCLGCSLVPFPLMVLFIPS